MVKTLEGKLLAKGLKFGIVLSRFNHFISERLLEIIEQKDVSDCWEELHDYRYGLTVDIFLSRRKVLSLLERPDG